MPNTIATSKILNTSTTKATYPSPGNNASVLRRYTTLPSLLHILHEKKITLLNPSSWDDRNDAFFMTKYRERKKAKSVLALCFSMASETYHHWRVFTHGSEGVCIEFDRQLLLTGLEREKELRTGHVEYKRIDDLEAEQPRVDALPFLKRLPYADEREFRLVHLSRSHVVEAESLKIDLKSIRRITLSPWMPTALVSPLKTTLHSIDGCSKLKVTQTTLLENERWKKSAIRK